MNAIEFLLTTLSPVLVTKPGGGDPNSEVTLPYIPGSAIRGMLIARWLADHPGVDAAADPTFRRLFLDGGVRYLNAYPALWDGTRMLPTPRSWRVDKEDSNEKNIFDFVLTSGIGQPGSRQPTWRSPGAAFCTVSAHYEEENLLWHFKAHTCTPRQTIAIHTGRANRQKVTENATVFRYDALAAGQTFASAIIADDPTDLMECQRLLAQDGQARLGRSQNTGYGLVQISYPPDETGEPQTALRTEWREWKPPVADAGERDPKPTRLVVTLLSDAIFRDPQTGAETDDIAVALYAPSESSIKPTAAFVRTEVVGGFNRRWNLPLPQATAIGAGSVFVFDYDEELQRRLERLVEQGIGERRAEGFGRIAVNWQVGEQLEQSDAARWSMQSGDVELMGEQAAAAQQLATRILRNRLDGKLREAISANAIKHNGIRKAQLSRLRVIAQRALAANRTAEIEPTGIPLLLTFLGDLKKPARDQLLKARVGNTPLLNWLHNLARDPSSVIDDQELENLSVTIGGQEAAFSSRLQIEYALRLIDGVLLLAAKRAEGVEYA
jgi:CRISPR-associated protein Csx10